MRTAGRVISKKASRDDTTVRSHANPLRIIQRTTRPGTVIKDDNATDISESQLTKTAFLHQLYEELYKTGTEEYSNTNLTVQDCPVISYWFAQYGNQPAGIVEKAARRYTGALGPVSATDLIREICEKARTGFRRQAETAEITELPKEVPYAQVKNKLPAPQEILQGKFTGNPLSAEVVQLGCCKKQAPPLGPAMIKVGMNKWATVSDTGTVLFTGGFGGCVGVVFIGPGTTRTLAHIPPGILSENEEFAQDTWRDFIAAIRSRAAEATQTSVYNCSGYLQPGLAQAYHLNNNTNFLAGTVSSITVNANGTVNAPVDDTLPPV